MYSQRIYFLKTKISNTEVSIPQVSSLQLENLDDMQNDEVTTHPLDGIKHEHFLIDGQEMHEVTFVLNGGPRGTS